MAEQLLALKNISIESNEIAILKDVSLEIFRGEIVGLLGVNGAGKSTTINIVAGNLIPDAGEVVRAKNTALGYVPDIPPLHFQLTVMEYLATCEKLFSNQTSPDWLLELLSSLDLLSIVNLKIKTLSKGQRQRVAIAQSLLAKPDILVLDEPTIALDPVQLESFRKLIIKNKPYMGVLFSTHSMQEVDLLCDSVFFLHQGKLLKQRVPLSNNCYQIEIKGKNKQWITSLPQFVSKNSDIYDFDFKSQSMLNEFLLRCLEKKLSIVFLSNNKQQVETLFLNTFKYHH